jgi:hypothetical protein
MCIYKPIEAIAEEDMTVYKIFKIDRFGNVYFLFYPYNYPSAYIPLKSLDVYAYPPECGYIDFTTGVHVKGYHCYLDYRNAYRVCMHFCTREVPVIYEFTIPKGTIIYKTGGNQSSVLASQVLTNPIYKKGE